MDSTCVLGATQIPSDRSGFFSRPSMLAIRNELESFSTSVDGASAKLFGPYFASSRRALQRIVAPERDLGVKLGWYACSGYEGPS